MARRIIIGDQQIELPSFKWRALLIPLAVLLLIWVVFAGPVYTVGPEENGVIKTFGKFTKVTGPGLRFKFPWPIQTVQMVNVQEVRRLELGFRTTNPGSVTTTAQYRPVLEEASMITGDENIVNVQMVVQYKIRDAAKFLFEIQTPERSVFHASEAALRQVVGTHPIDEVLTTGKATVEMETRNLLQRILDKYQTGVFIAQVKLQDVTPPASVDAAFKDVQSAKEDKEKKINEAKGYRNETIPRARGDAERLIREAEGYKQKRIKEAQGDAERFLKMLAAYEKAKDVTKTRLYLETMEEILPKVQKIVVDGKNVGNVVNVLGLTELEKGGAK